jgi:diguanylate cyclase (GGDEF)-like protein
MRILIAEDSATGRMLLRHTLETWGHELVIANDGDEAWQILQQEDAPRLVILDWVMPKLDGVDVCRLVRKRESATPPYILLLTAMDQSGDLVAGLGAGADDFVTKPFRPDELRARLEVGRRYVELNERLAEANRDLEILARTDTLTGVLRRRAIYDRLEEEVARSVRDEAPLCVGMLDIDHFKHVNDAFGHAVGDAVLREVVRSATSVLRPYDSIGRVGGEEFLVVLPGTHGFAAQTALTRIRAVVAATPVYVDGDEIPVTVSLGGAIRCGESIDELVARADAALYEAKNSGRDRVVMAGPRELYVERVTLDRAV